MNFSLVQFDDKPKVIDGDDDDDDNDDEGWSLIATRAVLRHGNTMQCRVETSLAGGPWNP